MKTVGEKVWNRLRAEGGFVWTLADGRKFVHFNKGHRCSPELRDALKRHSEDLKAFVDARHAKIDRAWRVPALPPGVGSSQTLKGNAPIGRGGSICECNADVRSAISSKTGEIGGSAGSVAKIAAISAAAALLAWGFGPVDEIGASVAAVPGGSVGLVNALFTKFSSGGGARVCLLTPGCETKTRR